MAAALDQFVSVGVRCWKFAWTERRRRARPQPARRKRKSIGSRKIGCSCIALITIRSALIDPLHTSKYLEGNRRQRFVLALPPIDWLTTESVSAFLFLSWFLRRGSHFSGLHRWRRLWRFGTAGNDPKFDAIFFAEAAVQCNDPCLIDAALLYQVVSCASQQAIGLSGAAGT